MDNDTQRRSWIDRKFSQYLPKAFTGRSLVIDPVGSGKLALKKVSLQIGKKRFLGIFPLYTIREVGTVSLSWITDSLLGSMVQAMHKHVSGIPERVRALIAASSKATAKSRIAQVTTEMAANVEGALAPFNAQQLSVAIKADRNQYRQKMLEGMSEQAAGIFSRIAAKHIGELVLRIREEVGPAEPAAKPGAPVALPKNTRFHVTKGKMTIFVIEEPPQTRTVKMMDRAGERSNECRISLPYVIFFVVLRGRKSENMYALFANKPLRSVDDALLLPALPNIHGDFSVCFAPSASKDTTAIMAEESVGNFWGGRFLLTDASGHMEKQITIDQWVNGTKKDSLFGLSFPWHKTASTVSTMLEQITDGFTRGSEDASQQKGGTGNVMTNLERVVKNISTAIANETKEALFALVNDWRIDEVTLQQLGISFSDVVKEIGSSLQSRIEKEINVTLDDGALEAALGDVVRQLGASLAGEAKTIIENGRESFLGKLKGELES